MKEEIVNRVANSALVTFDLESFYPEGPRMVLDISQWLEDGVVLREKQFRQELKNFDWTPYNDAYVAIQCSTNAIIPGWAYLLVSIYLNEVAKFNVQGSMENLESMLFCEMLNQMDISEFENKPVVIKGCAHKPIPENAYLLAANKLQPVAKSLMYGEACSSVPLYKKPK
ncbi:MAG: DUF2480 family protein [Bacteroidia bacterium]|nr:DUF2480 family protein [Bacteroidia bacterium]NNM23626.1 DUF2480 family protein [Flavobacteriaceae bacterium]